MPQLLGEQLGAAPVHGFCPKENDSNAESSDYSSLRLEAHTHKISGGREQSSCHTVSKMANSSTCTLQKEMVYEHLM